MSITPKVSILTLVYNHEKYIKDCLEGVIMQKTDFPFEMLVHDDASSDNSALILQNYASKYPNVIKPIFQINNQYSKHVPIVHDILLPKVKGKYVALCEGDDYWIDPQKLQKQVDYMDSHPDCGLCFTNYRSCYEFEALIENELDDNRQFPRSFEEQLLSASYIAPMTWLMRTSTLRQISDDMDVFSDGSYSLSLEFFKNSHVDYLPFYSAVYRSHEGSATMQKDPRRMWTYHKGVFETQIIYSKKYNCNQKIQDAILRQGYLNNLLYAVKANDKTFIAEAQEFFLNQRIDISDLLSQLINEIQWKEKYDSLLHNKTYRLGRALSYPIRLFKRTFNLIKLED